ENVRIRKLTDLNENEKCVIIGSIYKQQELKPNILKEISSEPLKTKSPLSRAKCKFIAREKWSIVDHTANVLPQPFRASKLTSADDKLILEDENLRVLLSGNINLNEFVTEIVYPQLLSVTKSPSVNILPENRNYYVLLLSGLSFGNKIIKEFPRYKLLADFLNGFFGGDSNPVVDEKLRRLCRLIIAGNSISEDLVDKNYGKMARYLVRKIDTPTVEAVQELDAFLASIATRTGLQRVVSIEVTILFLPLTYCKDQRQLKIS
uniref:DNA polymerase delta subunit OB-fold domain-containing protein n=1 Tax=Romanomermis culicivorax TaxID=13658 RepID=A0A915HN77_ROMCU